MDVSKLQVRLDEQSAWRKKEISQAHNLATSAGNEEERKYLCRSWVLILYAHCDSFLKEASRSYLEYLKKNIDDAYRPELTWLALQDKRFFFDGGKSYMSCMAFNQQENPYMLLDDNFDKAIFTNKSFEYKYLRFMCDWGLQISFEYESMKGFCQTLKEKRNRIAHGEEVYIGVEEDCLPWHHKTVYFIDVLKDTLLDNALSRIS